MLVVAPSRVLFAAAVAVALVMSAMAVPAAAQDTSGWLYVARGGEVLAMRPDGTGAVNLTQTPDRIEDEPEVSNASGRTLYVHFTIPAVQGGNGEQQGIGDLNLVSGGYDDRIPASSNVLGDPSFGFDDSYLYLHSRFRQIIRFNVFEGGSPAELAGDNFEAVFQPAGSPSSLARNAFAYVAQVGGTSAIRIQDPDVPQDGAVGSDGGNNYTQARYPSYAPDGSYVVFSCRSGSGQWNLCRSGTVPTVNDFSVIPTPTDAWSPVVSPDGGRVAWRDSLGNVWTAGIDGSNPAQISNGDGGTDPALGLDWGIDIPLIGAPPAEEPPPPTEQDPAPNTPLPTGGVDGDPATTDRAEFSRPGPFASAVSQARFPQGANAFAGDAQAMYAVLSRDDNFADSLAGSPLTARGPLLFTPSAALSETAATELQRVLAPGGTVYLLGGNAALSAEVEQAVTALGLTPRRLSGPSRFETAVAVADEVVTLAGGASEVIVARGNSPQDNPTAAWADSVTGGAYAAGAFVPVVVTPSDSLHPAVQEFVTRTGASATLLGGTAALSQDVQNSLPGSRRISGASRADTAGQIATELLGLDPSEPRTVLVFDVFSEDGWTFGLAGAGLAADLGAALLGSGPDFLPPETEALLGSCGDPQVESLILGWDGAIAPGVADRLDELDGSVCPG